MGTGNPKLLAGRPFDGTPYFLASGMYSFPGNEGPPVLFRNNVSIKNFKLGFYSDSVWVMD